MWGKNNGIYTNMKGKTMKLELTGKIKSSNVSEDKGSLNVVTKIGGKWYEGMYDDFNPDMEKLIRENSCWRGVNGNQEGLYKVEIVDVESKNIVADLKNVSVKNINVTKSQDIVTTSLKLSHEYSSYQPELERAMVGEVFVRITEESMFAEQDNTLDLDLDEN